MGPIHLEADLGFTTMKRLVTLLPAVMALVLPMSTAGAEPPPGEGAPPDTVPPCEASLLEAAREVLVTGMAASDPEAARRIFSQGEALARRAVDCDPANAEAHYLVAAALGLHLDRAGIRTKARMVGRTRAEAEAALVLDPTHAGAHHILGRLHAAAMRLGSVERFIARRILGGSFLGEASWDEAEEHFLRALEADPDDPRHALELGMLYLDTHRPDRAMVELGRAAATPVRLREDSTVVVRARDLLESLQGDPGDKETAPLAPRPRPLPTTGSSSPAPGIRGPA